MIMAKDKERRLAEELFVKQRKTQREVAKLVNVTEKTIGKWVDEYGWKERRAAAMSSLKSGIENINQLINIYTERAIQIESEDEDLSGLDEKQLAEYKKERAKEKISLVDAIAKLNKTKENFEKDHRIPYNVYINVTEQIMGAMLEKVPNKMRPAILDFFEDHINSIALNHR
jgi:transcriptional regulator with XRE-family HTH domain